MQGMSFLIAQIVLCLLIAAIIGGIIGWLLRGPRIGRLNARIEALEAEYNRSKDDYENLNARYRDDMDEKDRAISEYASKLSLLESKATERDSELSRLNAEYTGRLGELEGEIDRLNYIREDLNVKDTTIERLESELRQEKRLSADLASKANLSGEDLASFEEAHSHRGGRGWFNMFKNPETGDTLDSQVDDSDTPSWASGIKSTLASGSQRVAATASRDKSGDAEGKSWVESARERVEKATNTISEKAREVSKDIGEKVSHKKEDGESGSVGDGNTTEQSEAKVETKSTATPAKAADSKASTANTEAPSKTTEMAEPKATEPKATEPKATEPKETNESNGSESAVKTATAGAIIAGTAAAGAVSDKKESSSKATPKAEMTEAERERVRQIRESRGVRIERKILSEDHEGVEDDLKEIYGIGPVMEGILNDLGIYTFAQLAKLDEGQLEQLRDSIGTFRNRVDRDDWQSGARKCHQQKYGKPL